ncbi:hypothetical protein HED60_10375 [Planctomycetales bacterium ZRK34]|nr:hypothetical protein HED60_10375 [Planctomycetales bacterium ZRK34]
MFKFRRWLVVGVLLFATGLLVAGDAGRWDFQTVKAKAAVVRYEQAVRAADAIHQRTLADAQRQFIADLDEAKVDATKAGNLDEAVRLRDAIQAQRKTMPAAEADNPFRDIAGTWSFEWGTTGNRVSFVLNQNGQAVFTKDHRQLTIQDGRLLWISDSSDTSLELISANDRLIVLGWSRSKGRHPLKNQPNHVGIATRAE